MDDMFNQISCQKKQLKQLIYNGTQNLCSTGTLKLG